ncbi:MAG: lipid-A-disaccharide synthase [Candidatus Aminicenantes bacterium]|nr:lipid-A-disaccharide synthase [Candidatus Aminicenantes bacterium]
MSGRDVLIVAGEKSGENYGAAVVREFHRLQPETAFFGVGGTNMSAAGVEILVPMEDLAVMGLAEVVREIPRIKRILNRLAEEAQNRRPAAAVLIDSPDFNLRLARLLKPLGIPVLYYISPTVWAWRKGRLDTIRDVVRKMLLIFPFEQVLYAEAGIPHAYVGHPLLERLRVQKLREEFFQENGLDPDRPLITLLPGSRKGEIQRHIGPLRDAADRLRAERGAQFVLIEAEDLDRRFVPDLLGEAAGHIRRLRTDAYEAMAASDLVLSACGTANLESALLGTPLVAFYRISPLTYALGRPFVRIRNYSIVNILAGKKLIAELIQKDFTAANLVREAERILDDENVRAEMKLYFTAIRQTLGDERASENVARELAALL